MKKYILWIVLLFCTWRSAAHPMPGSVVKLSILNGSIAGEASIPLVELGNAVGDQRILDLSDPFFIQYFWTHIRAVSSGNEWKTVIGDISADSSVDAVVGKYKEVRVSFTLIPPDIKFLRTFTFKYDAVMHQVVTHSALIYVTQDWSNGILEESKAQQVGIIRMDIPTEKIFPLEINLARGRSWTGFISMLTLGMQHIKEGTDHLLFLIVLLLPSMLLVNKKKWGAFGGLRFSIVHVLKIVTAFTIGHSITLLAGALGWFTLPGQPVEVLIAFSILVSAAHAIYPLFPGKEVFIAAGFGLIHGLAFAGVLSNLHLSGSSLALSILGFNLGIEIMQLFIIILVIPWLIWASRRPYYQWVRIGGAVLSGIAAVVWIVERM